MTTITKQYATISGSVMKELKNMIKGHKKGSYPAINNLKIAPTEKAYEIQVTYTNSDIYAVKTFEAIESTIKEAFLLPIEYIKAVKGIGKGDSFTFELVENNKIQVTGKGIKQTLQTMDIYEYPGNFTNDQYTSAGNLFQSDLNKLKAAALSTSQSEARPILQSVLIRNSKIISTDSYRLFQAPTTCYYESDILVHKELINYITANEKKDFACSVHVSEHHIKLITHNSEYAYRIDGGNFPDVSRLIPTEFNHNFIIMDLNQFKNTLEAIKAATTDKNYLVTLQAKNDCIVLSNRENTINTEIQINNQSYSNYEKDPFKITFNPLFMLDALKQIESKNISLNMISNVRPFIVSDVNNNDSLSLILPIRKY